MNLNAISPVVSQKLGKVSFKGTEATATEEKSKMTTGQKVAICGAIVGAAVAAAYFIRKGKLNKAAQTVTQSSETVVPEMRKLSNLERRIKNRTELGRKLNKPKTNKIQQEVTQTADTVTSKKRRFNLSDIEKRENSITNLSKKFNQIRKNKIKQEKADQAFLDFHKQMQETQANMAKAAANSEFEKAEGIRRANNIKDAFAAFKDYDNKAVEKTIDQKKAINAAMKEAITSTITKRFNEVA